MARAHRKLSSRAQPQPTHRRVTSKGKARRKGPCDASRLRPQDSSKLVLSVDDEATVLYTREHLLRAEGYSVVSASGGKQALQLFSMHSGIDLVVLDYAMPDLNGLLVARRMKQLRPKTPILMVTGDQGALTAAPESCIDVLMAKGEPDQFLATVRGFLRPTIALGHVM